MDENYINVTEERIFSLIEEVADDETLTEFTQDFFEEFGDDYSIIQIDNRINLVYIGKLTKLLIILDPRFESDIKYFRKLLELLNEQLADIAKW
jgi:hypothetical protein